MASPRSVIINFVANDRVTGAVKGIGKSFDKLNDQMKAAAVPAAAAAGAAAGGALVAGIADAIKLDGARGKLEAQLGLTKTQSKAAGDVAGKLYASAYGDSMETVQTAITSVIQNMDGMRTASSAALKETTARAMDTATVMDEEVGATTRAVAQMMKTGLARNSQEAFDILVAGTQRGANKAQDLLDTFNEYGTQFRKLGLDGKTAMGLIQQGLQGGARDADIVADAFKEFSIRAIDGSKGTVAGFKGLGLSATTMAKQIAAGGPTAAKGLDTVLDRLRAVKDPVKQAEIATQLFGTQAEDLGKALFGLDPSKAVQSLGQVGGAADKAGKALGGTAQAKFEAFKRTLTQDVVGGLMAVVGWFQKHTTVAKVLAGVIGTAVAVYAAYNIALGVMAVKTAVVSAATATWGVVMNVVKVATMAWTGVQWLLNAALTANPIGLIVAAIALLIGGIVLAYTKVGWFRAAVDAAWSGIKTAIAAAWAFIKPVFMAIANILVTVVGTALKWYWAYVKFVFTTVWTIIQFTWNLIKPIFMAIVGFLRGVLGVAWIVLQNTIKVVWIAIQVYIKIAWGIIKAIFTVMKFYITNILIPIFKFLYNNVIKPVWSGIMAVIKVAWSGIKAIFNAIKGVINGVLAPIFRWLWNSVIKPVWNGIRATISTVYNSGIKPIFERLKSAVGTVRTAFQRAVDGIRTIWDKLKNIAKTPVNFIIGIYNKGIVGLVNKLASFAGIKTRLGTIPKLAKGGTLDNPMAASPMMTNGPMAIVGEGRRAHPEFVIPTDPAHRKRAQGLWAAAGQHLGGGPPDKKFLTGKNQLGGEGIAFAGGGSLQHLAFGGVIGGFVKGLKDFAIGNVQKAAKGVLGKILGGAVPGGGMFRDLVARIPMWVKDTVLKWIKDKVGFGGGPGMNNGLAWAKTQHGKGYQWGGNGNPSWDCSGFVSAIESVIRGQRPHRRWSTHPFHGGGSSPMPGWHKGVRSPYQIGVTGAGVGHVAGTLLGKNVESSGSGGVRVGGGARGATHPMFNHQYGFKADTGALTLAPGWNPPTFNGTGRAEYLETPRRGGGGEVHIHVENHGVIGSKIELRRWLVENLEDLRRRGRLPSGS